MWALVLSVLAAAAGVVLASALWGYAWLRLGGDTVTALDPEATALSARGVSPAGSTTVLVAVTEPLEPNVPDEPTLVSGVAVVQAGGPRDGAAVLVLPADLPVAGDRTLGDIQVESGLDGLIRAVVDYTGIGLDHAVRATSDALPQLVDIRGPVEVCTSSGCQELGGDAVRVLASQGDDVDRVRAIAAVVRSLAEIADARGALLSPIVTKRTIDVVADELRTDVAMRGTGLLDVAATLTEGSDFDVVTLPAVRDPDTGELVVLPERAEVVFQHFRDGTALTLTEADATVPLDDVTVAVLNGAGVEGLAARVQARLEAEGFSVVGTGNAPPFGHETTIVAYVAGDDRVRAAAIVLADSLGAGQLEPREQAPRFEGEAVDVLVTAGLDVDEQE